MVASGKLISLLFLAAGVFFLTQVSWPLISYKLLEIKLASGGTIVSPVNGSQILGVSIKNDKDFPAFYSLASRLKAAPYPQFQISVPSINLNNIKVNVDTNDLSSGLAQLPGTAFPGEKGNVFISGHSAIPLMEKNTKAYFANLPNVKIGEQILVWAGKTKFSYQVVDIKIVNPNDVSVILPPDSQGRFLSLMTCVPPGFNTKRLVVIGKII